MTTVDDDRQAVTRCDTCAVVFTVPAPLAERHARTGRSLWCPNGHLIGAGFNEPVTLALQRAQDLASELGSELALERIDHLRTHHALTDLEHGLTLGRCPVDGCPWEAKSLANHLRRKHPAFGAWSPVVPEE